MNRSTTRRLGEDFDGARAPVRGREVELAFIDARMDALARREGGIVLVDGPAGSGRTTLLGEAAAAARRRGVRVLFQGAADPDAQSAPLGPLFDGLLSDGTPLPDAARLRDLATTPGQRFRLLQELGDRLRDVALAGPLLIVLDDLQGCDDLTLLTFNTVAIRLSSHPILWLVAVRGGGAPPGVRTTLDRIRQAGAHELALGPLGEQAMARIAEDVLGAVPDPDVLRLACRAEGMPLLLVELLAALRDDGTVTIDNGTAELTTGSPSIRRLPSVTRRLGLLSDAARALVETAAAVGRPVGVGLLAELLDSSPAALITAVRESLDADLLAEEGDPLAGLHPVGGEGDLSGARGDRLVFRHALVREAVEAGLPHSVGRTLRRRAAEAPHEHSAAPPEPPTPPDGASEPGRRAAADRLRAVAAEPASTAPGAAVELSLKAWELTAEPAPERSRVVAETIPLLWQTGQPARARRLGESALATGGLSPEDEARIRFGLASLSSQFAFSEAVRQARTGAALPGIPASLRARLLALLCLSQAMSGDFETAGKALAEARGTVEAADDRTAAATLAVVESALLFSRMDWAGAFRQADRAVALAAGLGIAHAGWVPEALWQGFLLNAAGRSAEALAVAEAGVRNARKQGRTAATRLWLMNRARALLDAGRLTDALADAATVSAMTDELGPGDFADVTVRHALMRVALHTGDRDAVREHAEEARRMSGDSAPLIRNVGSWLLALSADFEGHPDRAMAALDEVVAALAEERPSLVSPVDPADAPLFVRMALRAGAPERASLAVAMAERRAALNPGFPLLLATAAHARGLLDNDLGHLLRAVRLYENCPRPLARASALEDTGRKIGATRRHEAVPHLETALALYTRAGAERDAARVRRRLRAAGIRRRPSSPGRVAAWPELTSSEARVVRLVARGLTNRQVAERLSLSPHTVGSHMRRAFTKLDITSRAELTRLAETRDSGE